MAKIPFVMTGADGWRLADGAQHQTGLWAYEAVVPMRRSRPQATRPPRTYTAS
ncbi:hypothetical protein [Streptomyces sp. NPDC057623]|uniref:hypothetical protein n=1 Tax=Streptomyces sp. NPDC057623 TaxID=3346187 RepID=UPI0036B8200B